MCVCVCVGGQLDPFLRLFSTILKWQKAEKKIMDGTFLELNAEKTQAEVLYSGTSDNGHSEEWTTSLQ